MKKLITILLSLLIITSVVTGCTKQKKLPEDFLTKAHESVKAAYGENYFPNMPLEKEFLKEIYGIPVDSVEEFIAEAPMISVQIDTFIGLKVKSGEMENVKSALEAYRTNQIENGMNYPMNVPKVNASQILVIEDYIFFLMLGPIYDVENPTEEEAKTFAEDGVKIAVDAINELASK